MRRHGLIALAILAAAALAAPAEAGATTMPASVARAGGTSVDAWHALARAFPDVAAPTKAGIVARDEHVVSFAADNVARISGPAGKSIVVSSRPLRTIAADGSSRPVDLTLAAASGGHAHPVNAPFALDIATAPAGGFALGPDAAHVVRIVPLDADPTVAGVDAAGQVLAAGTQPATDTVLRPTATGLETFAQLRGPDAPQTFRYRAELAAGQSIAARDGIVTISQSGRALVDVSAPMALDADRRPVPIALTADGDVLTMTVSHRGGGFTYPILADPDWESSYDWSQQAGIGTEGWFVDPSTDASYYASGILTEPVAPDTREDGFNNHVGIVITPIDGQIFPPGVQSQVEWRAPGTTHILSANFQNVDEIDDTDRQDSRLRLAGGSGPPPTDDYFTADPTGLERDSVPLVSPNGDAQTASVQMFTPPCTPSELARDPPICPRFVPADHHSLLKVGAVDITLSDDDDPTAKASGALRDLADQWTQGRDPLGLDLDFADPGSGVESWNLDSTDSAGSHDIAMSGALCDESHRTPGQGSNICPFQAGQHGIQITVPGLPEGQNRFTASSTDLAGNTSGAGDTSDTWSVYIDRTKPTVQASGPLADAHDTWIDPGDLTPTVHLVAHDDRSGIQQTRLAATDDSGAQVLDSASDACTPQGSPGQPCPNDDARDVTLDADTLPEGTLHFSATATDHVGLGSDLAAWTLHLDRTPPVARAHGDLVALQDQWTNQSGQVSATLDGRDALSGVTKLDLVAVNDDGRHVVGSVDTCSAADRDPTDGSCPHLPTATLTLDAADLPDGRNHFEVQAHDLAGHTSRPQDTWDTYIDHTAPPAPTGITVASDTPDTANIHWNPVVDVPEGAQGVSYQYLVEVGGVPVTQWTSTPYPSAIVPGLPAGANLTILVEAIDQAHNASIRAEGSGTTLRSVFGQAAANGQPFPIHVPAPPALVEAYAPTIQASARDLFTPVTFTTVYGFAAHAKHTCIAHGTMCVRDLQPPLTRNAGSGLNLSYPASNSPADQAMMINDSLGGAHQYLEYLGYYYLSPRDASGSFTIQYWYFWSFNYYDQGVVTTAFGHTFDLHEGDWEHYDVTFNAHDQPVSAFTSRHNYGHSYAWPSASITRDVGLGGHHALIYPATGDHAMYTGCGHFQIYHKINLPLGVGRQLVPIPSFRDTTCQDGISDFREPSLLENLAAPKSLARYACWAGQTGDASVSPQMPFRQSSATGAKAICGMRTRAALRDVAGTVAADDDGSDPSRCESWLTPADGAQTSVVACDQAELDAYAASGYTRPANTVTLSSPGAPPATRNGFATTLALDDPISAATVQISSTAAVHPSVLVSTVDADGRGMSARFPAVTLDPGETLHLDTSDPSAWTLRDQHGVVVASVTPTIGTAPPRGPATPNVRIDHVRAVAGGRATISWHTTRTPAVGGTFELVATPRRRLGRVTHILGYVKTLNHARYAKTVPTRRTDRWIRIRLVTRTGVTRTSPVRRLAAP